MRFRKLHDVENEQQDCFGSELVTLGQPSNKEHSGKQQTYNFIIDIYREELSGLFLETISMIPVISSFLQIYVFEVHLQIVISSYFNFGSSNVGTNSTPATVQITVISRWDFDDLKQELIFWTKKKKQINFP